MRVKIFYVLFLILLAVNVLADEGPLYVYNADCEKDGSMTLRFDRQPGEKIYTKDIDIKAEYIGDFVVRKSKFDVIGKWNYDFVKESISEKRTTFTSEEVMFKSRGEYLVTIEYMYNDNFYTTSYKTECPGFEFSCKLIGVYVDYCKNINNERFEVGVRIYGLGDITKENLSLANNIQFTLQAEKDYEDIRGKFSDRGNLPKEVKINNPQYGQYYFNISWKNKIKSFVAKIVGINYIEGGCVNYPNISLYGYKECKDIMIEEKKESKIEEKNETELKQKESENLYTGQVVKDQDVLKELERDIGTKKVKKSKWHLVALFMIFGLCMLGTLYILLKRNLNKESSW